MVFGAFVRFRKCDEFFAPARKIVKDKPLVVLAVCVLIRFDVVRSVIVSRL